MSARSAQTRSVGRDRVWLARGPGLCELTMATADDLRRLALALPETTEAPHFDRAAFRARRIYVTLAADGRTANLKFTVDEQQLKCLTNPAAFAAIDNGWGRQGWTTVTLAALSPVELAAALETAWRHATPPPPRRSTSRGRR